MMALSRSAWRAMMPRNFSADSGSRIAPSSSVSTNPLIAVIGVRSSWETFATKSRRKFSSRRMRVMSFKTTTAPICRPEASCSTAPCACSQRSPFSRRRISFSVGVFRLESVCATNF